MVRAGIWGALLALVTCVSGPVLAGEGFGGLGGKTVVTLMRRNPPAVVLPATSIRVQATTTNERVLSERLATLVEVQLLAGDKRLSAGAALAQVLIRVGVLESVGSRDWQSRTYTTKRRGGGEATVVKRELVVRHKLTATYAALHANSGASIDSASITLPYEASFDEGHDAPQLEQLASDALDKAANRIVARLTFTRDAMQVLLPEGSLDALKSLAQAGAWNKYLEALEALPPRPKPRDESYRQFALGIAHEALAYAAEDPQIALNYLEQAALLYDKAISMKPDEQYFLKGFSGDWLTSLVQSSGLVQHATTQAAPPLARVQESIARYQKIKELAEAQTASAAASATAAPTEHSKGLAGPPSAAPPAPHLDNQAVLRMVKAGIAEDVITTAIRSSARTAFDVSSAGLIALSEGGVATGVLREMQAAAGQRAARRRSAAAKGTPGSPRQ